MSRPKPISKSQKRVASVSGLIITLVLSFSVSLVDAFGTWRFPEIPSFSELVGFLLIVFACISLGTLVIFWMSPEDYLRVTNPLPDLPLVIKYGGVSAIFFGIDQTLFMGQGTSRILVFATEQQALISLLFSGLLVLLYYDQHQTQRQQVEIMSQQASLEKRQIEWQEKQRAPQINIHEWDFRGITSESGDTDSSENESLRNFVSMITPNGFREEDSIFSIEIENTGKTPARDLRLQIEPLVSSPSLPSGYHDISILVFLRTSQLIDVSGGSIDQYLNREQSNLATNETTEYIATISAAPIANFGKEITSIGDAISALPFEVAHVVFRATIVYEDLSGERHEEPIGAVRLSPNQVETVSQAFALENRVEYHSVSVFDKGITKEIFEERYAQFQKEGEGVIGVQFNLNEEDTKQRT